MKHLIIICVCWGLLVTVNSCDNSDDPANPRKGLKDWTDLTHGDKADPNYEVVFDQTKVNALEIHFTKEQWDSIQSDMKEITGIDFGQAGGPPPGPGTGPGPGSLPPSKEPSYFAISIKFNGKEWYRAGFRLKGNSSLFSAWAEGVYKLPFRLNFDKFEGKYPIIKNQRLYGFQELTFSPGFADKSLLREKVTADILRKAGIPAAETSFIRVYMNFGDGLKYCGIYTVVEVIEDTMVKKQFGGAMGNIYKPESNLKTFIEKEFEKKNNKDINDYSDVKMFVDILNSPLRTSDPERWRTSLESSFNIDHFLKWLAVNTTMGNSDSYGMMPHNYYLYNDPQKKLTWIPWDHNMAMFTDSFAAPAPEDLPPPGGDPLEEVTLSLETVSDEWPLIRFLADNPVYYERYKAYVKNFKETIFTPSAMNDLFDRNHALIAPYVDGIEKEEYPYSYLQSPADFVTELEKLKAHVLGRNEAVEKFIQD